MSVKRILGSAYNSNQDEFIFLEMINENILFSFHFKFATNTIFSI